MKKMVLYLLTMFVFASVSVVDAKSFPQISSESDVQVYPFDLSQIRLLDGPLKDGLELNTKVLLNYEPDRFLCWFRESAGLEAKAEVYGGWESAGVAGHCLGHYLSGCSQMYASTGDTRLKDRVDYIIDELEICQNANGDGYLFAIPGGKQIYQDVKNGKIKSAGFSLNDGWVPIYTSHKVFAGLRDAYRYTGNTKALDIEIKLGNYWYNIFNDLSDEQMQEVMKCEHGGINETLADLYADTGNEKFLKLSKKFFHKFIISPTVIGQDRLSGEHANTQIPKFVGISRIYELTGEKPYKLGADFFWDRVVNHHSYATGGNCIDEHFGNPDTLSDRLGPNTTETCNVYNMLKLTNHEFGWNPSAEIADFYERAFYNHMLATQHPVTGRVIYNLTIEMGGRKHYQDPYSFTCCVGSGMESHSKYGESIYFHNYDSLYVNLFAASQIDWKEKGLKITQQTRYPQSDSSKLVFECKKPVQLEVKIRYPYWATNGCAVKLNGKSYPVSSEPSSYITLDREWKNGDSVEFSFPMSLRLEAMPDNKDRRAIMYGPLVLAGDFGAANSKISKNDVRPMLLKREASLESWIKPVAGEANAFTLKTLDGEVVALRPFFQTHDRVFSIFWDFYSKAEWSKMKAEIEREKAELEAMRLRTVDELAPGEQQPEVNHNFKGENTDAGSAYNIKYRDARNGWFSYDMAVLGDKKMQLVCNYWGGENNKRVFDILVDGVKIATQTLFQDKPGEFIYRVYDIPEELTKGKSSVNVKFESHPDSMAGGLFGCKMIK